MFNLVLSSLLGLTTFLCTVSTMEKVNIDYSLKNIPVPPKDIYTRALIEKTEQFLQRVRWKTFFFQQSNDEKTPTFNTYGFKTSKNAPHKQRLSKL